MTTTMAGVPFWQLTFDPDGDQDAGERDRFLAEVRAGGITDLVVFAHGWNNDRGIATRLYERFFGGLPRQPPAARRGRAGPAGAFLPPPRGAGGPPPPLRPPRPARGAARAP